jgi:hypothetical protein
MDRVLASPNSMVWRYFHALRRLCCRISQIDEVGEVREDAALCIILAVTGVEVFFNVYFRVCVSQAQYNHAEALVLRDLESQASLDRKIRAWPTHVFGVGIELGNGIGQRFIELKERRNGLVHFASTHETIQLPKSISIHGLADISFYNSLDALFAAHALRTAEQFICEVFRLQGVKEEQLRHSLHAWTGRPPVGLYETDS